MNRRLMIVAASVALLLAAPLAVLASSGGGGGRLDRQRFGFFRGVITTRSTTFHDVPGASGLICARGGVSAAVSVTTSGGPFALLVRIDNGPVLHPGAVRFSGGRIDSTAYTWVGAVGPFEASDHHSFAAQWKSVTGRQVTLRKAVIDVLYQKGTAC